MENSEILFITGDEEMSAIWAFVFKQKSIRTTTAGSAAEALGKYDTQGFDLVLIDAGQDPAAAIETSRSLRAHILNPLLVILDQHSESWQLAAYEAGADECIAGPTSIRLVQAKISAWLRRSWHVPTEVLDTLCSGIFCLDSSKRMLTSEHPDPIALTNLEFRLLHLLMSHPGHTMKSDYIVDRVWGHCGEGDKVVLKNVVYRLRRKIEPEPASPRYILNTPGEGYVFKP